MGKQKIWTLGKQTIRMDVNKLALSAYFDVCFLFIVQTKFLYTNLTSFGIDGSKTSRGRYYQQVFGDIAYLIIML